MFESSSDASVTFVIDKNMAQKLTEATTSRSVSRSLSPEIMDGLYLEISLNGGYNETKTVPVEENTVVKFENIPVGINLYAEASAYKTENGQKIVFYEGKSENVTIRAGENSISLAMRKTDDEEVWSVKIYVSANGDNELNDGSKNSPLASIDAAIRKMDDADKNYTIIVDGIIEGAQTISDTDNNSILAKSVTITGKNTLVNNIPQDVLRGIGNED